MGKSNLEQKLQFESELVRNESMLILKEFEETEDLLKCENYSSDDFESSDE